MTVTYTEQEKIEIVRGILSGKTTGRELQRARGICNKTTKRWKEKYGHIAKLKEGFLPAEHKVSGTSTLYDEEGNIRLQWVKTNEERESLVNAVNAAIDAAKDDLPKVKPIRGPEKWNKDLAAVIPIGDAHIGMFSWGEETGNDFNLDIAKRELCGAFQYLIDQGPSCDVCVIVNVGDFLHYSKMEATTERSGHVLDASGRAQNMVRVGVAILRFCIEYAAKKHSRVVVINSSGNHDGLLAHTLNIMLANIYENNKQIDIQDQPTSRHYFQHGKVLIGVTHGHQTKDRDLPGIMATERPEQWGQTRFRTWFRGHHHHDTKVEYNGAFVEQIRTLAPNDAYAASGGYLSGSDLKQIIYHRNYGEQGRTICGIDLLRSILGGK